MGHGGASSEGDAPASSKVLARVPLSKLKGFDLGDVQPGGTLDVTAHCQLSGDGEYLEVLKVDGEEGEESPDDALPPDPTDPDNDPHSTPGDRWAKHFGRNKRS